jgi:hypothetical protein
MITGFEHLFCIAILFFLHFGLIFLDFFTTEHTPDLFSNDYNGLESPLNTVFKRLQEDIFGGLDLFSLDKHLSPDIVGSQKEPHT